MTAKKIGVVSLGLIGGSLLKALATEGFELFAVTRNQQTIENAKAYTKNVSSDLMLLKDCDVVFVCSPMSKTLDVLDALEKVVMPSAIVADVCSLKEFVMQKERPYIFIGSHPMAGTENSGFEVSFRELFEGANWVLTPSRNADTGSVKELENIIKKTGAKTLVMAPDIHDRAAALISHMPMLVAQALVKTAMKDENAIKIASSGFRDMTRLALSNTRMAEDMVLMNSKNISESLISLIECVRDLLNENYLQEIETIRDFRLGMYNSQGKNISN